ncbi:MAG: hypothetical protein EBS01_07375 [Verrucomicrobia bacterium]|nr:hypothetical protein [Verrucomicrobiota bacterium]
MTKSTRFLSAAVRLEFYPQGQTPPFGPPRPQRALKVRTCGGTFAGNVLLRPVVSQNRVRAAKKVQITLA